MRSRRTTGQILRASSRKVEMRTEVSGLSRHHGRSPNISQGEASTRRGRACVELLCLLGLGRVARPSRHIVGHQGHGQNKKPRKGSALQHNEPLFPGCWSDQHKPCFFQNIIAASVLDSAHCLEARLTLPHRLPVADAPRSAALLQKKQWNCELRYPHESASGASFAWHHEGGGHGE